MARVTFLLAKDPTTAHGGDLTLARMLMDVARQVHDVRGVCLSADPIQDHESHWLTRVPKPALSPLRIGCSSMRSKRSLVHARFDNADLVKAIDAADEADLYVADHSYMAESFLRSKCHQRGVPLLVNTVVSESFVWSETRGVLGRVERARILRDELRVARASAGIGTYDKAEAAFYREHGVERAAWLSVTLPPKKRVAVASAPPTLVFVGDRGWPPNQRAFKTALQWWPEIAAGIDDARLLVVGRPKRADSTPLPDGVTDLGFVDDLDATLAGCRALIAPVGTGGGVRVKILDAVSRGLPVIGTPAAVGSLGEIFDLPIHADKESFVEAARSMLSRPDEAAMQGAQLHRANLDRWESGVVQGLLTSWLAV